MSVDENENANEIEDMGIKVCDGVGRECTVRVSEERVQVNVVHYAPLVLQEPERWDIGLWFIGSLRRVHHQWLLEGAGCWRSCVPDNGNTATLWV